MSRGWDHACRHRSCPQGASLPPERWLALQQARGLAWDPSPGLCPLPHALQPLGLANVPGMPSLVLQAVRETLGPLLAAPKSLGAPPGIIAARPPWRQTLGWPPPVPCLVTGGGRTPAGPWVAVRHGVLLPARGGMAGCRGKMLDALRRAWGRGAWGWPEPLRSQPLVPLLTRRGHPHKTRGNVRSMER